MRTAVLNIIAGVTVCSLLSFSSLTAVDLSQTQSLYTQPAGRVNPPDLLSQQDYFSYLTTFNMNYKSFPENALNFLLNRVEAGEFSLKPGQSESFKFDRIFQKVLESKQIPESEQRRFVKHVARFDPDLQFRRSALYTFILHFKDETTAKNIALENYLKLISYPDKLTFVDFLQSRMQGESEFYSRLRGDIVAISKSKTIVSEDIPFISAVLNMLAPTNTIDFTKTLLLMAEKMGAIPAKSGSLRDNVRIHVAKTIIEILNNERYFDPFTIEDLVRKFHADSSAVAMGALMAITRRSNHGLSRTFFESIVKSREHVFAQVSRLYLLFYFRSAEFHPVYRSIFSRNSDAYQAFAQQPKETVSMAKFAKSGSLSYVLNLPDQRPIFLKVIPERSKKAWKKAFDFDWHSEFGYNVIEGLYSKNELASRYNDSFLDRISRTEAQYAETWKNEFHTLRASIVYSDILMGLNFSDPDGFKSSMFYFPILLDHKKMRAVINNLDATSRKIKERLEALGIYHGHYFNNLVVTWQDGQFRISVIDFDQSRDIHASVEKTNHKGLEKTKHEKEGWCAKLKKRFWL